MRLVAVSVCAFCLVNNPAFADRWGGASIGASLGVSFVDYGHTSRDFVSTDSTYVGPAEYRYFLSTGTTNLASSSHNNGLSGGIYAEYGRQYGWFLIAGRAEYNLLNQRWDNRRSGTRADYTEMFEVTPLGTTSSSGTTTSASLLVDQVQISWQINILAKLGITVSDDALIYGLLGASQVGLDGAPNSNPIGISYGAGIAYALTSSWSLQAEYLRTNFSKMKQEKYTSTTAPYTVGFSAGVEEYTYAKASLNIDNVRVGAAYKFSP